MEYTINHLIKEKRLIDKALKSVSWKEYPEQHKRQFRRSKEIEKAINILSQSKEKLLIVAKENCILSGVEVLTKGNSYQLLAKRNGQVCVVDNTGDMETFSESYFINV